MYATEQSVIRETVPAGTNSLMAPPLPGAGDHAPHESRMDATRISAGRATVEWSAIYARLKDDANDADALAALMAGVLPWVERHLRHPTLRPHREDVVAETCSAAVTAISSAYGPETFMSFVYGHYLNARRRVRQGARIPTVRLDDVDLPLLAGDTPAPDELTLLEQCLAALPARERRAVELRYFLGASDHQIASALDVTTVNARRIVFNGLQRLRRRARQVWPLGRC